MKKLAGSLTIVSLALLGVHADAGESPKYGTLPTGTIADPPMKGAPAAIGARESVPGIFVVSPQWPANVPAMHRHVTITADRETADMISERAFKKPAMPSRAMTKKADEPAEKSGICLTESDGRSQFRGRGMAMADGNEHDSWTANFQEQTTEYPKNKDNPRSGVVAIHAERLVEQGGGAATLETTDFWVDPGTRGTRVIGKNTIALTKVGGVVGNVNVYAFRDEAKKMVHFVVSGPREDKNVRGGPRWATLEDGSTTHTSCGHLRVSLSTEDSGGQQAVVEADVRLPSPKKLPPDAVESKAKDGDDHLKETKRRQLQIQLSVSKTSRDKEPVLSISYNWAGRETSERNFGFDE